MFSVTSDFEGGNAKVINISEDKVTLNVELRDTVGDWFFWCFKVSGAGGRTIEFEFESDVRVGYFGAAVSYDKENWKWQYETPNFGGKSFTYTFADDENEVYFAHDMVYSPDRFFDFAKKNNLKVETLCKSEKGRDVPYVDTKEGEECIILTSRHHACESTGNYVLEGVLERIFKNLADKFRIICVPFVDYDGVIDGDQGKGRNNHDHNRDYEKDGEPIYTAVAKIREFADNLKVRFAFDFHSPWHWTGHNDTLFVPIKCCSIIDNINEFSNLFEKEMTEDALPYLASDNMMPNVEWNKVGAIVSFAPYMESVGAELAFTLETPYFIANGVKFTPERGVETGRCFEKALEKYINKQMEAKRQ